MGLMWGGMGLGGVQVRTAEGWSGGDEELGATQEGKGVAMGLGVVIKGWEPTRGHCEDGRRTWGHAGEFWGWGGGMGLEGRGRALWGLLGGDVGLEGG